MTRTLFLQTYHLHNTYLKVFDFNKEKDEILFVDSDDQWTHYTFHQQRIVYHLAAMHHRMEELRAGGYRVRFAKGSSLVEVLNQEKHLYGFKPTNHYEQRWLSNVTMTLLDDPLFLVSASRWPTLLPLNKPWKLDPLYRRLRQEFSLLMHEGEPIGGRYSFDTENRKTFHQSEHHEPLWFVPDAITQSVIEDVRRRFGHHPGSLDSFQYPVTRDDALLACNHFMMYRLATFGDVQDMMDQHDAWLSHSLLSVPINLGLLSPLEVLHAAEKAYKNGLAPLAATEGFMRQILGWREYVRGVYLVSGPNYLTFNELHHTAPLPDVYYSAESPLKCVATTLQETRLHGYNHHIQRLMVLSNYANLIRVKPQELNRWFNEMYIDSFEWIVAANVIGMGLFADGGKMSTKPYISSGAYIHKMSNYCQDCQYDVTLKTGPKACPFNSLYWTFLHDHQRQLQSNPRMTMLLKVWEKMDPTMKAEILQTARMHLS